MSESFTPRRGGGYVHQTTIENSKGENETYGSLAEKIEKRHYKHKASLETKNPDNTKSFSAHFLAELEAGREKRVTWKVLESKIPSFNPVTASSNCAKKFFIVLRPYLATLNNRQEIFSYTRHKGSRLLQRKVPE